MKFKTNLVSIFYAIIQGGAILCALYVAYYKEPTVKNMVFVTLLFVFITMLQSFENSHKLDLMQKVLKK